MSFTRGNKTRGGFAKPSDSLTDDPGRFSRDGWTHERDHESIQIAGRQYRNMKEWSRPCSICGTKYSVFEKSGAVDANSRFGNKTCDQHRGLVPAFEKGFIAWDPERSVMVAGPKCAGGVDAGEMYSRMKEAEDGAAAVAVQAAGIRKAVHEQLGLSLIGDAINYDSVTAAIQALKAKYELGPALKQFVEGVTTPMVLQENEKSAALYGLSVTRTFVNGNGAVETVHEKMPWE